MDKKITKIVWKGETFYLPYPVYVDLDELNKKFYKPSNMVLFLFMKSILEWAKKIEQNEKENS